MKPGTIPLLSINNFNVGEGGRVALFMWMTVDPCFQS